jgi:2-phosphosulfolactate phosphatase
MRIDCVDFVEGARAARGVAIVIDVFRACSVACYAAAQGAGRIIPLAGIEETLQLKRAHPEFIALGERHGRKLPGFDYGNSPTELESLDLRGRTILHNTHAGTQGLVGARAADMVLTGSLVNAAAICRYVVSLAPAEVTLVRMGVAAAGRSDADDVCAELLRARLTGQGAPDQPSIRERLRVSAEAHKFFDPAATWAPEGDFERCTALDRFDFVLQMMRAGELSFLRPVAA